uniref:Complex I intermediate-associated protein 30, mitochondrial n=1 Tax=Phallusia mammillata TaxID=59560 RepID=A0A6F9DLD2_9ASCI|nr:complex I intermediate-associated protein 30, mitochondrial [Phallusia mammillata]
MANPLVWVLHSAGRRFPSLTAARRISTGLRLMQNDEGDESGITVKKETPHKPPQRLAIHWPKFRQSWKHIQFDIKNRFSPMKKQQHLKRLTKEDHVVYYFRNPDDLRYWYLMTDEDIGGYSWSELRQSKNEMTALFRGYLSNRRPRDRLLSEDPLAERPRFSGFAFMETKPFITVLDKVEFMSFIGFNVIKLRIRGDGRKYMLEAHCDLGLGYNLMYTAPVHTNGGPLWQEVKIPYCKLIASKKSGLLSKQSPMDLHKMTNFRFLLNDGIEGPFQLEIDYIAFERDYNFPFEDNDYYDPWLPINSNSGG